MIPPTRPRTGDSPRPRDDLISRERSSRQDSRPSAPWLFVAGIGVGVVAVTLSAIMLVSPRSRTAAAVATYAPASLPRATQSTAPAVEALDQPPESKPRSTESADLIEFIEPSVVRIDTVSANGRDAGVGSGFFVHESGIVATNYHVVRNARSGEVTLADGAKFPIARFLAKSERQDLALLAVNLGGHQISPARLATANPRKGEDVLAMGAPHGLDFSASKGIVSAVRSAAECRALGLPLQAALIQTTTPISPGNSGGPLLNMRGEVIGVNTLGSSSEQVQNLNFAVSVLELSELFKKSGRP